MHTEPPLWNWPLERIDAECADAHADYDRGLSEHYADYFAFHPDEAGEHRFSARSLEAALPTGWGSLAKLIPTEQRHRYALSGKSSQTLALGTLGVPAQLEPDLTWLWELLDLPRQCGSGARIQFEVTVDPELLNERPRQTSIDVLAETDQVVVCIEAKLREAGIGPCSCPAPERRCSRVMLEDRSSSYGPSAMEDFRFNSAEASAGSHSSRPYWRAAMRANVCPVRVSYQAVRNVAAARALAHGRQAVFCLLYDERNPYFTRTGEWPGWPAILHDSLDLSENVTFRSASWQELIPCLPLDDATRTWAAAKHGLRAP